MSTWYTFKSSFAGPPQAECAYRFDLENEFFEIAFLVQIAPFINPDTTLQGFFEGLWHHDCGELWLCNPESGRYIEINLAPDGAWWSCVFSSPRVRDIECPHPKCSVKSFPSKGGWTATLQIPKTEIKRCLSDVDNLVGNITLVLGGDSELENLHSAVPLGAMDFHRPQDWVPLSNLI